MLCFYCVCQKQCLFLGKTALPETWGWKPWRGVILEAICFFWGLGTGNHRFPFEEKRCAWGLGLTNTGFPLENTMFLTQPLRSLRPAEAPKSAGYCLIKIIFVTLFFGLSMASVRHALVSQRKMFLRRLGVGKHVSSLGNIAFYEDWGFTSAAFLLKEKWFFWSLVLEAKVFSLENYKRRSCF